MMDAINVLHVSEHTLRCLKKIKKRLFWQSHEPTGSPYGFVTHGLETADTDFREMYLQHIVGELCVLPKRCGFH